METKNIIIGVLTIGIIVMGVLYYQECNNQNPISDNAISKQDCSSCVDQSRKFDKDQCRTCTTIGGISGKAFNFNEVGKISQMIQYAKVANPHNEIYGYQIELKYIEEMMKDIEEYDDDTINKDKVDGIRFYEAISTREIEGIERTKADLVMIPYFKSGADVYKVDEHQLHFKSLNMYAHFRPCPKMCGKNMICN